MNFRDLIGGLFWIAIALVVGLESAREGLGTFHDPGPGFLPFWAAVALGILSAILLVTKLAGRSEKQMQPLMWSGAKWARVVVILACLFGYAMLINTLGYMLTTFIVLFFLFGVITGSKAWTRLLFALFTALATFTLFDTWLGVQLPKGILGF